MFEIFKKLFNKQDEDATTVDRPAPKQSAKSAPQPPVPTAPRPQPKLGSQARPNSNGNCVYIYLQTILNGLPLELKARVRQTEVGEATITVPLDKILSQLASGSVKIPFGEIRRVAQQVFSTNKDCDQVTVALPLEEILSQIDPSLLVRRQNQKLVEVPEEISSPFGDRGHGLALVSPGKTPAAPVPSRSPAPTGLVQPRQAQPQPKQAPPKAPPVQPVQPKPVFQPKPPIQSKPAVVPPRPFPSVQPAPIPAAPIQHTPIQHTPIQHTPIQRAPIQPAPVQPVTRNPAPSTPTPPPTMTSIPASPMIPAPPELHNLRKSMSTTTINRRNQPPKPPTPQPTPQQPEEEFEPEPFQRAFQQPFQQPVPQQPQPFQQQTPQPFQQFQQSTPQQFQQPVPQPAAESAKPEPTLAVIPLAVLAEAWSEAMRQEISQSRLTKAEVALPAHTTEEGVRRGKLAFPWKVVRSWIRPTPPSTSSAQDGTVVDLPLKVIAPLVMARSRDGKPQQKVAIDEEIPNLFFGFPQGEPAAAEPAPRTFAETPAPSHASPSKSLDTNYYVWDDSSDSARVDETAFKRRNTPGTEFVTRYATPNEVVSRAAAMEGVMGALIALPDGLMVASKISSDLNGDTLAAFLPHIFGKVSQCTKELRMGELNNLNFTVGNVPWKIFRVNAIFFAAFGRVGQPLPTAQLAALAAELDHKKQ